MTDAGMVGTIVRIVTDVLSLKADQHSMDENTLLLGHIPEFDSMSIVSVIAAIEDEFLIQIPDDELSAEVFESIGSLAQFVTRVKAG